MSRFGRQKGARGELAVVHALRDWWQVCEPGVVWQRTGEMGRAPREFRVHGDVTTTSAWFPFTVEVKNQERWSPKEFFAGRASPVWSWWRQAVEQARDDGGSPMLWFRRSRFPWMVMLDLDLCASLKLPPPLGAWGPSRRGDDVLEFAPAACWQWVTLSRVDPSVFRSI